jgi:hypothetical protein
MNNISKLRTSNAKISDATTEFLNAYEQMYNACTTWQNALRTIYCEEDSVRIIKRTKWSFNQVEKIMQNSVFESINENLGYLDRDEI